MHLPTFIDERLDLFIKTKFGQKPDLFNFFKNHEKRPLLVKNLIEEIKLLEFKSGYKLNSQKIQFIIDEFAKTFCHVALKAAEKSAMTEAERQRRLHEEHEFNEIQEFVDKHTNWNVEEYDENKK